jgi:serine protease inhibitor
VDVPMMRNQKRLYYINFPQSSFEAIALPYNDYEFVMHLILPYANQTVKNVLDSLEVTDIVAALARTQKAYIDYKIPRMKFHKSESMKEELKKLGLNNFFEKGEFDNLISSTTDLDVSDIMHAVEMETNEDGTMASAASSITFNTYSVETPLNDDEPIQFYLNRPFMFFITHKHTFTVMFAAMVHNPLE